MTSNIQLQNYINRHEPTNTRFLGVFASDKLPRNVPRDSSLIANYSPSSQAGTHWVTLYDLNSSKNKPSYFFDSYGERPDQPTQDGQITGFQTHFYDYLKQNSSNGGVKWNTHRFQQWEEKGRKDDDVCGQYSVGVIIHGPPDIQSPFWGPFYSLSRADCDRRIKRLIKI